MRRWIRAAAIVGSTAMAALAWPQTANVTTHHYDNLRTGWNSAETILTPGAVAGSTFGLQRTIALDEQVDAQPLLVNNQTIAGGNHNVLYVVTENDTVYALDAATGAVLISRHLGTPVPQSTLPGNCGNNSQVLGVSATPVIDAAAGILYLIAYTYEGGAPIYRLHALGITTLQDTVPAVEITASAPLANGKAYSFTPAASRLRSGLLLNNGNVYAGFASFCDFNANVSRGWVLGWKTGSLTPLAANKLIDARSSSPDNYYLSGVWMSGAGLASNPAGDVYLITGNSDPDGIQYSHLTNLSESVVQLASDLSEVKSLFTPSGSTIGHETLDKQDLDFGAGGVLLLPPQAGAANNLAVAAGKIGAMYLLNADTLGNNSATATGTYLAQVNIGGCWCTTSYFTGSDGAGRVVSSGGSNIIIWTVRTGAKAGFVKSAAGGSIVNGQDSGFFTSVSSNGTATPVIWAVGRPLSSQSTGVTLYAFDDAGNQLFSGNAGTWPNLYGNANIVPVVADGRVYVASYKSLALFGLSSGHAASSPAASFPVTAKASSAVKLAPGQHEFSGTIQSIDGNIVRVMTRRETVVEVDASQASADFLAAPMSVGSAVLSRGTIDDAGIFHAQVVQLAKDNPAMWLPDR